MHDAGSLNGPVQASTRPCSSTSSSTVAWPLLASPRLPVMRVWELALALARVLVQVPVLGLGLVLGLGQVQVQVK